MRLFMGFAQVIPAEPHTWLSRPDLSSELQCPELLGPELTARMDDDSVIVSSLPIPLGAHLVLSAAPTGRLFASD